MYKATKKFPTLLPGCDELVSAGAMYNGLIAITRRNERIKLVNSSGKEKLTIMPVDGKEVVQISGYVHYKCFAIITEDGKCGAMNQSGKIILPPIYRNFISLSDDIIFAEKENDNDGMLEQFLLTFNGKEIVKFSVPVEMESEFHDGKALVMYGEDPKPGYINKKGEFSELPSIIKSF